MLYEFSQFMKKSYRILASLGTLDTGLRKTKLNTKQNPKNSNTSPTKTTVSES